MYARCYRVVAVYCSRSSSTRAINLFKCYSEIISEHDRIVREFKFVACTQPRPIFRDVLFRLPHAHHSRLRRRHTIRPRPGRSNVCTADGIENTHTHMSACACAGDGRAVHYYANLGISRTHGVYTPLQFTYYYYTLYTYIYTGVHAR